MALEQLSFIDVPNSPYDEASRILEDHGIDRHAGLKTNINADPGYFGLISPALRWYSGIKNLTYKKLDHLISDWRTLGLDEETIDDYLRDNPEEIACRDIWVGVFGYAERPSADNKKIITSWMAKYDIASIRAARFAAKNGKNNITKDALLRKTDAKLKEASLPEPEQKTIKEIARDNIQRIILGNTFKFLSDPKAYRFMRWPYRTGIGKTYTSMELMSRVISDGHQFIYLSPQVDDLLSLAKDISVRTHDPSSPLYGLDLKKDIVLVPSNVDAFSRAAGLKPYPGETECVKIHEKEFMKDAIDKFGVSKKTAQALFSLLKEIDGYDNSFISDRVKQSALDEFYSIKRKADEEIKATLRSKKKSRKERSPGKYKKIRGGFYVTEEEYNILIKYYPAVALDSAKIVLMTFKKAQSLLEPFGHYTLLGDTECLENAVLFVDEADSLMMNMLQTQIENRQNPNDIYKFFTSVVHGHLDLRDRLSDRYGLDREWFDKDGSVLKRLKKLETVIEETLDEFPILSSAGKGEFKPVFFKKESEDIDPTLVQFPDRTKVFACGLEEKDDKSKKLYLVKDNSINGKRIITLDPEKCTGEEKLDWAEFKDVTGAINRVITNFIATVRVLAEAMYMNHNCDFSYESATSSALARFAFEENDRLFVSNSMYSRTPEKLQKDNIPLNDKNDPYAQGFACIGLTDSDEHFDQTYITADFMKMQPNAQLRHIIESAYATILSSATGNLRSITNFDFDTIRRLISESHEDSPSFKQAEYIIPEDDFEEMQKWCKYLDIDVDVIYVERPETGGRYEEQLNLYVKNTLLGEFWNSCGQIKGYVPPETDSGVSLAELQLKRLNGAAMFMKEMLSREYAHFGVVFQTANVKQNAGTFKDMYNETNIKAIACHLEKNCNPYNRKLTPIIAKARDKEDVRRRISNIRPDELIILITSENSFGVGVNLEQKTDDLPRDPDGLFLGAMTNIIGSAAEKPDGSFDLGSERLKRITLVESMHNMTKNCIDLDPMGHGDVDYYLDTSLTPRSLRSAAHDPQPYSAMSPYKQVGARNITQSIGRGDRQKGRNGSLVIMYDSDIIEKGYLSRDMFEGTLISNSLDALLTDIEARRGETIKKPEKVYLKAFRRGNAESLRRHRENLRVIERYKRNGLDVPESAIHESALTRDLAASLGYPECMVHSESEDYMDKLFFTDLENHKDVKKPRNIVMQKRYGQQINYETVKYKDQIKKESSMERIGCHVETIIETYRKYDELTGGELKKLRPGIFDKTEFALPPYTITEDLAKGQLGEESFKALFETRMQTILKKNGLGPLKIKPLEHLHEDFDFEIEGYPVFIDVKNRAAETKAVAMERLEEKVLRMEPDNALVFYVNMEPRNGDRVPQSDVYHYEFGDKKIKVVVIQGFFTQDATEKEGMISTDDKLNNIASHIKEFL